MTTALKAGIVYFVVVFLVGFALGTVRSLFVAPRIGDFVAVVLELPIMLTVSWLACGWTIRRFAVPWARAGRFAMGAIAFILLLAAEAGVSVLLGGLSVNEHLAFYRTTPVLIGLGAQIAFALFPMLRRAH